MHVLFELLHREVWFTDCSCMCCLNCCTLCVCVVFFPLYSSHQNGVGERNGDSPVTSINEIMEDGVSSSSNMTQAQVDSEVEGFGSTLAEYQHQRQFHGSVQPSVSSVLESMEGVSGATASGGTKMKNERKKGRWSVGSGKRERRVSEEQSGVTLSHLAHPTKGEGISMSSFSQEVDTLRVRGSSESSLSSRKSTHN